MTNTHTIREATIETFMPTELYEAFQAGIDLANTSQRVGAEAKLAHAALMTILIPDGHLEPVYPHSEDFTQGVHLPTANAALDAALLEAKKIATDRQLAQIQDTMAGLYVGRRVLATPAIKGTKPLVEFDYSGGLTGLYEWTPREVPYFQRAKGPIRSLSLGENTLAVTRDNLTGRMNKAFQRSQVIDADSGLPMIRLQFLDN